MDGNHGIRSGFYDMEQHTIVPYRSHPVLKNMGYTSTVNDIIYRKRTNELCFATWDDGVWFYNVKAGKAHVVNTVTNPELSDICIYSLLEDSKGICGWGHVRECLFWIRNKGFIL